MKFRFIPAFFLLTVTVAACSAPIDQSIGPKTQPQKTFTAADKKAAMALSVAGAGAATTGSPQDQAIVCTVALPVLVDRLRQSGMLSALQLEMLNKVQIAYRKKASDGLTPAELNKQQHDVGIAHPEQSERLRLGIGCLQRLTQ